MAFEMTKLTMGEISVIEEHAGERFAELMSGGNPSAKGLAALAMVVKRREQMANGQRPTFSFNEAQDMVFEDVMALITPEQEESVEAPKEPSTPSKTTSKPKTKA